MKKKKAELPKNKKIDKSMTPDHRRFVTHFVGDSCPGGHGAVPDDGDLRPKVKRPTPLKIDGWLLGECRSDPKKDGGGRYLDLDGYWMSEQDAGRLLEWLVKAIAWRNDK